ncbi:class I SAM-dependent methyltransferase [Microbacterium protaetiae]|uniref:Class I SAM-dependent methyltransferase n=1 Tax=Microbacterium protaetiae TaxID=2509458 RepID=A0A4P6EDK6_9MICO|nr:class I SAM-dependent methyltransferase [Microbacterium protaetiae]QAY60342.1 class I SAM-dependent methyltransferase [Microbacterium protaetiae]
MAYEDSRLVELYDIDNPDGSDHDFYRSLADEAAASSILDLGCGTGMLTVSFTHAGRIVGVDPSAAMLAFARTRPGTDRVEWIQGDSRDIPRLDFDYAVMTGNVAQHIGELDWPRTLRDLRRAMRPGATLAFETRNPLARAWENWPSPERRTRATAHGPLVEWMFADETTPGTVRIQAFNLFTETGETVVEDFDLQFRGRMTVQGDLESAGFDVDAVYGDWSRKPFQDDDPLMVFVAHAQ